MVIGIMGVTGSGKVPSFELQAAAAKWLQDIHLKPVSELLQLETARKYATESLR